MVPYMANLAPHPTAGCSHPAKLMAWFHSYWCIRCSLAMSCIYALQVNFPRLLDQDVKVKVWTLAIVPLTWVRLVTSSALQSRKWQLIGMSQWCRSALCGHPLPALTDNWTHGAASRHTVTPISHTRPSPHSRSYYSFPVSLRVGGWVDLSTQ